MNGKPSDYTGGRTENEIVLWVSKKLGSSVFQLKDKQALNEHLDQYPISIAYFGDKLFENYKYFEEACIKIEEYFCV